MNPTTNYKNSLSEVGEGQETDLVARCQAGDQSAFEDIYRLYIDRIRWVCTSRLGNQFDAEDAAQETFTRAWKALPTFGGDRHLRSWLEVIARNVCIDYVRKQSRTKPTDDRELEQLLPLVAADEVGLSGERIAIAVTALKRLSTEHQEVLRLRETLDWSYKQIATHQDVSVPTVQTRILRARRALRSEFFMIDGKGVAAVVGFQLRKFIPRIMNRWSQARTTFAGKPDFRAAASVAAAALVGTTVIGLVPHTKSSPVAQSITKSAPATANSGLAISSLLSPNGRDKSKTTTSPTTTHLHATPTAPIATSTESAPTENTSVNSTSPTGATSPTAADSSSPDNTDDPTPAASGVTTASAAAASTTQALTATNTKAVSTAGSVVGSQTASTTNQATQVVGQSVQQVNNTVTSTATAINSTVDTANNAANVTTAAVDAIASGVTGTATNAVSSVTSPLAAVVGTAGASSNTSSTSSAQSTGTTTPANGSTLTTSVNSTTSAITKLLTGH